MNFTDQFRIKPGSKVSLAKHDPDHTPGFNRNDGEARLETNRDKLRGLHELLYAENKHALLVVLQAMDTGGKDGVIRHVMSGLNPVGVKVHSFKQPTPQELGHDFLWRIHNAVPAKGEVGLFNRSQYEDVLVVRVHKLVSEKIWRDRYEQINEFERLLSCNNVTILKFFLHISKEEQLERLEARLANPQKQWKFSPGDLAERKLWSQYMRAYQDAIERCSTSHAPWFIVPSNKKWFRDVAISEILVDALQGLRMKYPKPDYDVRKYAAMLQGRAR